MKCQPIPDHGKQPCLLTPKGMAALEGAYQSARRPCGSCAVSHTEVLINPYSFFRLEDCCSSPLPFRTCLFVFSTI